MWQLTIIALLLGLIVLCILVWMAIQVAGKVRVALEASQHATARIVKIEATELNKFEKAFYPVVEFDFNQKTYVVRSKVGYMEPPYDCGENVKVWFSPEKPEEARLSRF
jgi:hypothetical protein